MHVDRSRCGRRSLIRDRLTSCQNH
jgi:hypothetical protein